MLPYVIIPSLHLNSKSSFMKLRIICAVCAATIAFSCNRESKSEIALDTTVPAASAGTVEMKDQFLSKKESALADTVSMAAPPRQDNVLQSGSPVNPDWDKKIIKTANITLELKDYKGYSTSIHAKIKSFGAYIAQEQQSETDDQIVNSLTIKVPVDQFDELVNALPGEGIRIIEKNISTEDVTGEVIDTKARLEAKKQVRERYLELLKQAKNMEEILQVQNEINSIQEDIESAAGRINYLVHASAYSTVNLKYYQYLNGLTQKDLEPGFFSKLSEAFKNGTSVITSLVLFFISIWPLMIVAITAVFYFKRIRIKKA